MLEPPEDIWDAVSNLLILYRHVPSVIGGPVYIGHIDRLLEPFVRDEEEARHATVSYTHLDVYKRQGCLREPWRRRTAP